MMELYPIEALITRLRDMENLSDAMSRDSQYTEQARRGYQNKAWGIREALNAALALRQPF